MNPGIAINKMPQSVGCAASMSCDCVTNRWGGSQCLRATTKISFARAGVCFQCGADRARRARNLFRRVLPTVAGLALCELCYN